MPPMDLYDRLTLDGPRRDSAGNLVASVLAARTGIQDYAGYEVGKPEMARVKVYRPAEEVFSRDSMKSYAGAPVTVDHPNEMVTPGNWRDHARGEASEEVVRDGEAVRVPFMLRDAAAIAAVDAGKREVSMGYTCDLDWTAGQTADGQAYDAIQRNIRINHLAIVDRARGGPTLRIGDSIMTKIKIGDAEVDLSDAGAVAVAVGTLGAKLTDAQGKVGQLTAELATATTSVATKDGEIAALTQKLKDAEVTPAKLQQLADARAKVIADAKAIAGAALIVDGKTDAEIKRAAVSVKLGDAAKDMADAAIDGAFLAFTPKGEQRTALDRAIATGASAPVLDAKAAADAAYAKHKRTLADGYLKTAA